MATTKRAGRAGAGKAAKPKAQGAKATKAAIPKKRGPKTMYRPEMVEQAKKLAKLGAIDPEVADFFGVTVRCLRNWIVRHPELGDAMKMGKEPPDDRVERSLYMRAVGFEQAAVKVFHHQGKPVVIPYTETVAPDPLACIYWLNNRRRGSWSRNPETPEGADDAPPPSKVVIGVRDARRKS